MCIDDLSKLNFKRVQYESAELIKPYFSKRANLSCDATPFNMIFWSEYYGIDFCCTDDALLWLMEAELPEKELCAGIPICKAGDLEYYIDVMYRYFRDVLKRPFLISCIDSEIQAVKAALEKYNIKLSFIEHSANADYLYDGEKLRTLSGKKLHAKKNMCNSFEKIYLGRYEYRELTGEDSGILSGFLTEWINERESDEMQSLEYEYTALKRLFAHGDFSRLAVKCGGVFIDGRLCAFTLGSYCCENGLGIIHIEKAFSSYKGCTSS